ncbi:MAG TPA: hypothetical protein VHG08_01605 [Longimicrobium sp.]|nr:hypothetical protein [Longimicrobium sp.]
MHWKRLMLAAALVAGAAEGAAAQAWANTAPRDVRDIFLALPVDDVDDRPQLRESVGDRLSTRAGRVEALREGAEIDPVNYWIRTSLPALDGDASPVEVILSSYRRPTGRYLVVLQVNDRTAAGPRSVNYAWEMEGSTFRRADIREYLPDLEYADFWEGPRPRGVEKDFFLELGAFHLQLPRYGERAAFHLVPAPAAPELAALFQRPARSGVELLWDRRRGVFVRGDYLGSVASGERGGHHHHD